MQCEGINVFLSSPWWFRNNSIRETLLQLFHDCHPARTVFSATFYDNVQGSNLERIIQWNRDTMSFSVNNKLKVNVAHGLPGFL